METIVRYRRSRLIKLGLVWFFSVVGFLVIWATVEYFFFPVIPKHVMKQLYLYRDIFTALTSGVFAIWLFLKEDRRYRKEKIRMEKLAVMQSFSSYMVHEIRNPLASLSLNTELLQEEVSRLDVPKQNELMNLITPVTNAVKRITEITEKCFSLARRESLTKESFDPTSVIKEIFDSMEVKAKEQGVRLTWKGGSMKPVRLFGNPQNFRDALDLLIQNAFEAMPQGGELLLRGEVKRRKFVLTIMDTGTGMTQEVQDRLFDPFFTTKLKGKGLGLCLAWQALGEFDVTVRCRSRVDKGTSFQIRFPLLKS